MLSEEEIIAWLDCVNSNFYTHNDADHSGRSHYSYLAEFFNTKEKYDRHTGIDKLLNGIKVNFTDDISVVKKALLDIGGIQTSRSTPIFNIAKMKSTNNFDDWKIVKTRGDFRLEWYIEGKHDRIIPNNMRLYYKGVYETHIWNYIPTNKIQASIAYLDPQSCIETIEQLLDILERTKSHFDIVAQRCLANEKKAELFESIINTRLADAGFDNDVHVSVKRCPPNICEISVSHMATKRISTNITAEELEDVISDVLFLRKLKAKGWNL
ncbi:MAG: hypothetical protein MJZ34_13965 [Paludibacteraceae bacterium]|nr:hypothetical protein [Paludibacteraceae bacterium]